jgi:7-cyano-7-deazaguanine reductase
LSAINPVTSSIPPEPIPPETVPPEAIPPEPGPADATVRPHYGERAIAEAQLICFDNPRPGRVYEVAITLPEFTCLCPFSGYPDFASLQLLYQPGPRVLELKALKLYVNRWRDITISHEEVVNRILDDLVLVAEPLWMQLEADFNPRGNVHTVVTARHGQRHAN